MSETIIARMPTPTFAYLIVANGDRAGTAHQILPSVTDIGRVGGNDVRIDDDEVSSQHARIRVEDGSFRLYDLASTNGTRVNGETIQSQSLRHDDAIEIGDTVMVFKQA